MLCLDLAPRLWRWGLPPGRPSEGVPIWAYPVPQTMPAPSKPDNTVQKKVPGSKAHFTEAGVNDRFNVPDWFPKDHPPLPEVVAHGRQPKVFACGYCHLPNGQGRPENAPLAGQPAAYIIEQVTRDEGRPPQDLGADHGLDQEHVCDRRRGLARRAQDRRRLFLQAEIQEMDPGGGDRHRAQVRRLQPQHAGEGRAAAAPSRSATASSRCRKIWS